MTAITTLTLNSSFFIDIVSCLKDEASIKYPVKDFLAMPAFMLSNQHCELLERREKRHLIIKE